MVAPKSILITPERPRTPGKRNVLFEKEVVIIGGERIPLAEPAATNDELTFDFNPPESTGDDHYSKGGPRAGTMRIKGGMANMYAKAAAAEEERRKQEEEAKANQEPVLLSGYMKVLKESGAKSSWQKRFITLTSHAIAYHRSADAFKAMKSFELNGDCFVREISQRTGVIDCKNALEVVFSRNKSLVLKGVSQRESTEWITAICAAIDVFAPSEDEFDFVDEDEFVDEDDLQPSGDPAPFTAPLVMTTTTTVVAEVKSDSSVHVEAMQEMSVSEEDSFEWVDEDEMRTRDTDSSSEKSQAEKVQKPEEDAQMKHDADAQKSKAEADAKAKAEADAKAKAEADAKAKAKAEADAKAKVAAETKAKAAERERVAQETRKKKEAEELARKEAEKAKQEADSARSKIQSRVATPGPAHHPNFQANRSVRPSGMSGGSVMGSKPRGGRVGNLLAMFEPPK